MEKVVICEPLRTLIGAFGGTLKDIPASELGSEVVEEILDRTELEPEDVDDCIMGNILTAGQGMNPSRQVAMDGGLGEETPAFTVNRVCGSGLQAVALAAQAIRAGDSEVIVAGGIENMNKAPFLLPEARYGYNMGMPKEDILDSMVYDGLWDVFNDYHMGITAENLVEKYDISREEQDQYAYKSQMKAKEAMEADRFQDEIVPVEIPEKKGESTQFKKDEHPRPDVTLEGLGNLPPVFDKDGTVTAGNASGINDGAAAMIVTTEEKVESLGLEPIGSIRDHAVAGVDPAIMGIGPVPAMEKVLEKSGLSLDDIDLVEENEAFAGQTLAVLEEFPIPDDKLNVNGGAIAFGHPIGATGAILTVKILHEMEKRDAKRGLVALCIGGGMGIAMIVENGKYH